MASCGSGQPVRDVAKVVPPPHISSPRSTRLQSFIAGLCCPRACLASGSVPAPVFLPPASSPLFPGSPLFWPLLLTCVFRVSSLWCSLTFCCRDLTQRTPQAPHGCWSSCPAVSGPCCHVLPFLPGFVWPLPHCLLCCTLISERRGMAGVSRLATPALSSARGSHKCASGSADPVRLLRPCKLTSLKSLLCDGTSSELCAA